MEQIYFNSKDEVNIYIFNQDMFSKNYGPSIDSSNWVNKSKSKIKLLHRD